MKGYVLSVDMSDHQVLQKMQVSSKLNEEM